MNNASIAHKVQTQVRADIEQFLQLYRPEAAAVAYEFPIISVNGGQDNQGPFTPDDVENERSLEGDLDGEMVLGISWPTSFTAWVTGGEPPFIPDLNEPTVDNEPYLEWQQYLLAQPSLPQVISSKHTASKVLNLAVTDIYLKRVTPMMNKPCHCHMP